MLNDELVISLRNIFLIQLAVLALAPERVLLAYQGIARMWKSLLEAARPKKAETPEKGFWEIDMTDFEP